MYFLILRLTWGQLRLKPFARIAAILSVSIVLCLGACLGIMLRSFSDSLIELKHSQYLTAFLDYSVSKESELQVLAAIKNIPGVTKVDLVSKDAFAKKISGMFPQISNDLAGVDTDVLPRYVKVRYSTVDYALLKTSIEKISGIESVEMNQNRFEAALGAMSSMRNVVFGLLIGMCVALVSILLNHFKLSSQLALQTRSTLASLGARPGYLFLPFALEGAIEGGIGGILAALLLMAFGQIFESRMNHAIHALGYFSHHYHLFPIAIGIAFVGLLSGMMGSLWVLFRVRS